MGRIIEPIKERRSIRNYKNKEVSKEKIRKVLEAANWAPSNGNSQPWEFVVAKDEYAKKISKVFYDWAKDYIPNADYIPEEKKKAMLEYSKDFGGAPVQIVVTYQTGEDEIETEESLMAASAAIQNLSLAALEEDLGTVWIAGHIAHADRTKEIIDLAEDKKIAGIIPIGYPDIDPAAPPRKDPNLVEKVKWLGF
ncbi:nitroreductase [Halobacteroides halobius DSM 5150]|uniref:Nitroreductase n=1 Tax=Halobacteroides halobius (strain ATCC 35273 / DSM 5150 / MD-1) TaxID=748449 RepID=L0K765_HALHC|nr:nitroreductase family protein [Halobacteroides halobius]AGB40836.1 nitroreductase [Halobacteroides halobius DSM 5150]